MKSLTRGNFKAATVSLRSTKGRSFFTMLGIIIGVASVITIVSIGEGIKHQVNQQVDQLGRDLITVRPASLASGGGDKGGDFSFFTVPSATGALPGADIAAVANTKNIRIAVPLSVVSGSPKGENGVYSQGLVLGASAGLTDVINQPLAYGSFYQASDDGQNVAVLGQNAARHLFNEQVPLGRSFELLGQQFIVRGVFSKFDSVPLSTEADFNNTIFVPYLTAQQITKNNSPIYEILARPTNAQQTDQAVAAIKSSLAQASGGQSSAVVLKQNASLAATNKILDLLTRLIGGVAAISLLVGGIGIMNITLASVAERMQEIGIRKALGATNRQILEQFVIESTVLSVVGGLIGVAAAFVVELVLRLFTDLNPVISWWVVLLAVGVSLVVGVVFGSVPAIKAARKNPIEALRNE